MGIATEALHAENREAGGTRACRRLRERGLVPAVVYGRKEAARAVQVKREELEDALRRRARMFELHLGRKKDAVLLREVQYDAFGDRVVHADFVRVALDEEITLEVPIQLKGHPKVEHAVLEQTLANVRIECLPRDIPETIVLQVADMEIDQTRTVRDLAVPPGVKVLTDPEVIVAAMTAVAEEAAAPGAPAEAAAAVEPELIRKEKPEEAEEGAEEEKKK
ncbi:MAG: 50S ribosomal protein L25 [Planctomycetes bacterium]|nr:50S ribosomal protein L25 [Planctomycetota bacterium]